MLTDALKYYKDLVLKGVQHTLPDGREFLTDGFKPAFQSSPDPVRVCTLEGFRDFVKQALPDEYYSPSVQADGLANAYQNVFAQIVGFDEIHLISDLKEPWQRRHTFAIAKPFQTKGFEFDRYHDTEKFIVGLQANFEHSIDRDVILRLAGTVTAGRQSVSADDGVSQTVSVKRGVHLKGEETIPNPVFLLPRRGFPELPASGSNFVLRLRGGEDEKPSLALFEADGGAWQLDARKQIADWLQNNLPGLPVIS